jgi:hypothetical protein
LLLDAEGDLLAQGNLTLEFAQGDLFHTFVRRISGATDLPFAREVRAAVLSKASEISAAFRPKTEGGPYASLRIDGAGVADRT